MTSSTVNKLQDDTPSPIPGREDDVDDVDVANDDQPQNWLTIRRRCELCKQRKVRSSDILASFVLVFPGFRYCFDKYLKYCLFLSTQARLIALLLQ